MQCFLVFFSILSILIFTLYWVSYWKLPSDLSHFLIKGSIINIIIIIIIIIINFNIIIIIVLIIIVMVHASHGRCVNAGNLIQSHHQDATSRLQGSSEDLCW